MPGHSGRRTEITLTVEERRLYVRWWINRSGLTPTQLRQIATGIWADRPSEDAGELRGLRSPSRE